MERQEAWDFEEKNVSAEFNRQYKTRRTFMVSVQPPSFLLIANIGAQNPIKTPHPVPRTMSHVPLSRIKALLPLPFPANRLALHTHEPKAIKSCTRPVHRSIALSCALPEMKRYTCAHYSSPSSSPSPSLSPSPSGSSSPIRPLPPFHSRSHGGSATSGLSAGCPGGSDERARCSRASKEDGQRSGLGCVQSLNVHQSFWPSRGDRVMRTF